MADQQLNELTALTTPTDDDNMYIENDPGGTPGSFKITWANIKATLESQITSWVTKALFDANTILAANSDNTPAAVTVAEQTLVGRITGGNIVALTVAQVKTLLGLDLNTRTVTAKTASYEPTTTADSGNIITMSNASANTFTIPLNSSVAYAAGTVIEIVQLGAGVTTIATDAAGAATLNGVTDGSAAIDSQYDGVSLINISSDVWVMTGAHGTVS